MTEMVRTTIRRSRKIKDTGITETNDGITEMGRTTDTEITEEMGGDHGGYHGDHDSDHGRLT